MRVVLLIVLAALVARAEFREVDVAFEDTGCVPCTESLQGRLERVRGTEKVDVDLDEKVVRLDLEAGNRVRLAPLLARITQDGTVIKRVEVRVVGDLETSEGAIHFRPAGLSQSYRLELGGKTVGTRLEQGTRYELRGVVTDLKADGLPLLTVSEIQRFAP